MHTTATQCGKGKQAPSIKITCISTWRLLCQRGQRATRQKLQTLCSKFRKVAHADVKTDFRWSLGQTELVVQLISERTDPWWEVLLFGRIQDATENARVALPSFSHSTRSETHDIGRARTLAKGPSRVQPPPVVDKQPSSGHNESTYWSLTAGATAATAAVKRHWKSWSDDENGSNSWLVGAEPRVKVLEHKSSYCTTVQQRNMPQYLGIALTMLAEVDDAEAQGTVGQIIQAVNMFGVQTGDAGHITEAVAELHVQTGFRWQSKPYSLGGVELSVHLTLLKPAQNVQDQLWEVLAFVFAKEETKMECIAQPFAHPALAIGNNEMPVREYDDSSAIRHMPIELYF